MKIIRARSVVVLSHSKELDQMEEEILDIVNDQDEVVGVMTRSQAYAEHRLSSTRAVWLMIKNQQGAFWIPQRSASKVSCPSALDGSAVGHVSSGETYEQAMVREAQEELNLNLMNLSYRCLGKLTPTTGSVAFIAVFELQVSDDFVIDYNAEDFSGFFWLTPQEIIKKYEEGCSIRKTLVAIMKTFY
ncbi:NUDIX hydrolase [Candidatus Chromulinivorax destructor]|uniref:NUDIX hydrolase n=1 Tax=Candidatus Chromulinivorax destructor TaxID=2066483 RepID=UPI0013B419FF|nr:NUDIX domain-containing protein [Candidatus Chromulinivorax destructor]